MIEQPYRRPPQPPLIPCSFMDIHSFPAPAHPQHGRRVVPVNSTHFQPRPHTPALSLFCAWGDPGSARKRIRKGGFPMKNAIRIGLALFTFGAILGGCDAIDEA